jgi:hypothetical protein
VHRVVIALTALLSLTGAAVVGGYLLLFAGSLDRAAELAPDDTLFYVNVYLQPSAGQRMNVQELMTRFPGYGDPATLDDKIDETLQRFLADADLDYRSDVKPWLGTQLAMALSEGTEGLDEPAMLVIAHAADPEQARAAIPRLAERRGDRLTQDEHAGVSTWLGTDASYALVDDMLVIADSADRLRAAIDADRGARRSLAADARFVAAMRDLPPDHLASAYLDLAALAERADTGEEVAGSSTMGVAVIAEREGLRLVGQAPLDESAASAAARASLARGSQRASLTGWMPADTEVSVVIFGVAQALESAEAEIGAQDEFGQAVTQLRAIVAFGLGINLDTDVLPLFDHETALAVIDLEADPPRAVLLLRPSDAAAAEGRLTGIQDALESRGSAVTSTDIDGATVTTVTVPEVGALSWTVSDGVVVLALDVEAVGAALDARRSGESLAASAAYRSTFDLAGDHAGNEVFVDIGGLVDLMATGIGLGADARAMLEPIQAIGITMPARDDRIELHLVIPVD